jgi:uncharacterized DUF497 family protein
VQITGLTWDQANVAHIARHQVTPTEVEEVCFGSKKVVLRARRRRYAVLGQTAAGRYLKVIVTYSTRGRSRVITAREMSMAERRYYHKLRKR